MIDAEKCYYEPSAGYDVGTYDVGAFLWDLGCGCGSAAARLEADIFEELKQERKNG